MCFSLFLVKGFCWSKPLKNKKKVWDTTKSSNSDLINHKIQKRKIKNPTFVAFSFFFHFFFSLKDFLKSEWASPITAKVQLQKGKNRKWSRKKKRSSDPVVFRWQRVGSTRFGGFKIHGFAVASMDRKQGRKKPVSIIPLFPPNHLTRYRPPKILNPPIHRHYVVRPRPSNLTNQIYPLTSRSEHI